MYRVTMSFSFPGPTAGTAGSSRKYTTFCTALRHAMIDATQYQRMMGGKIGSPDDAHGYMLAMGKDTTITFTVVRVTK